MKRLFASFQTVLINSDLIVTLILTGSFAAQPSAFAANTFTDQLSSDAGKGSITGTVLGVPLSSVIVQPIAQANLTNGGSMETDNPAFNIGLGPLSVAQLKAIADSVNDTDNPTSNSGIAKTQLGSLNLLGGLVTLSNVTSFASISATVLSDGTTSATLSGNTTISGLVINGGNVPLPNPIPVNYSVPVTGTLPVLGINIPVQGTLVVNERQITGGVGLTNAGVTVKPALLILSGSVPGVADVSVNLEVGGDSCEVTDGVGLIGQVTVQ